MKTKDLKPTFVLVLILFLTLVGCFSGGHGSIKKYEFKVNKQALIIGIKNVIAKHSDIWRDSIPQFIIDVTGGKHDSIPSNHYNDGENYWDIHIALGKDQYQYTVQTTNGSADSTNTSNVSIAYAHDKNGDGGSEGSDGVSWRHPILKKELVSLFETKFLERLEGELGQKHTHDE